MAQYATINNVPAIDILKYSSGRFLNYIVYQNSPFMRLVLLFSAIFLTAICSAQSSPYKFPKQIDTIGMEEGNEQDAGVYYSRIGNYKKGLEYFAKYRRRQTLSKGAEDSFKLYHAVDGDKFILEEAKKHQIVIINEGHHIPLHRAYLAHLLPELRKEGFEMMGIEALGDSEVRVMDNRGYPYLAEGGYLTEPCFGNMVRKAYSLGFKLFEYESDSGRGAQREKDQANKIIKMIEAHPSAKFLIYCGYDHHIKDTIPGADSWGHAMAGWVKLKTGIDPMTIDQVTLTEMATDSIESPYRRLIHSDHTTIMLNSSRQSLKPKPKYNADYSLYHPDTKYIHGRPTWQISEEKRTENINAKITIGYPCLAFVYRQGEDMASAIPADVIEIKSKEEDIHVILEKKYKNVIVLKNQRGEKQVIYE